MTECPQWVESGHCIEAKYSTADGDLSSLSSRSSLSSLYRPYCPGSAMPAWASAIIATETANPARTGNFAPCRAGGSVGNHLVHSLLAEAKSSSSASIMEALTAFCRLLPAASRLAEIFRRHCATCASTIPSMNCPVEGSTGAVPRRRSDQPPLPLGCMLAVPVALPLWQLWFATV